MAGPSKDDMVVQGAMIQCRQALKPDGLFLSAFWGGDTLQVCGAHCLVCNYVC